jgi:GNAT superfamily N-acetyltransferase
VKLADNSVQIRPLGAGHERKAFSCGIATLDRYIREQASQDIRRRIASVFVATSDTRSSRIMGYYTLSAASIAASDLPADLARRLPRHPIPAALVGRLAVDLEFARRGLGTILVADAVKRAMAASESIAITVVVVDPLDEPARAFYAAFGFQNLQGPQQRMFLVLPRAPG